MTVDLTTHIEFSRRDDLSVSRLWVGLGTGVAISVAFFWLPLAFIIWYLI